MALAKITDLYRSVKERFSQDEASLYKSKGFTYYDLVLIAGLIGIIAAFVAPNLKRAVNMDDVKRHGAEIIQVGSMAEKYVATDDTPTFAEFETWALKEQKRSIKSYHDVGIAFTEPISYNNNVLENKDARANNAIYVVACRGHEHPDVMMLDDFYSQQQKEKPKVRKLYSVNNKSLEVLAKGDNDWFSEIIEENYK